MTMRLHIENTCAMEGTKDMGWNAARKSTQCFREMDWCGEAKAGTGSRFWLWPGRSVEANLNGCHQHPMPTLPVLQHSRGAISLLEPLWSTRNSGHIDRVREDVNIDVEGECMPERAIMESNLIDYKVSNANLECHLEESSSIASQWL